MHPVGGVSHVDVHQTICVVDIAGYGGMERTRPNYVALRAGMYKSVKQAFAEAGIPWSECFCQGGGERRVSRAEQIKLWLAWRPVK
jgi:hypothetical protein